MIWRRHRVSENWRSSFRGSFNNKDSKGDAWSLHAGDMLRWLMAQPDASFDALITDPPYSSGGQFRSDRLGTTDQKYTQSSAGTFGQRPDFTGDNRDQRAFLIWMSLWLGEALRVLKVGAPICVFSDWRQLRLTDDALQVGGVVVRGYVPWDKTEACRPAPGFSAQCEYVIWGSNGPRDWDVYLPGIIRCPVRQHDKHHQTGKPTEVMRALVKICPPGGLILDPFAGSGTTGVAALLEGRRFVGCELNAAYHGIAERRLREAEAARQGTHATTPLFGAAVEG